MLPVTQVQIDQAADAVLALINRRSRTPSRAEVAAVINNAMTAPEVEAPKRRAEWDMLAAQARVANATPGTPDQRLHDINTQRDACAQRILADAAARQVRGLADFRLLADVVFWLLYGGDLAGPEADTLLATGATQAKVCDEALAALFRAAHDVAG